MAFARFEPSRRRTLHDQLQRAGLAGPSAGSAFTSDHGALEARAGTIDRARADGAVRRDATRRCAISTPARKPRKVLIVVSDGGDNASRHAFQESSTPRCARTSSSTPIGICRSRRSRGQARTAARAGRGHRRRGVLPAEQPTRVTPVLERIARDIRSSYTLGYAPPAGTTPTLAAKLRSPCPAALTGKLKVRARSLYLASGDDRCTHSGRPVALLRAARAAVPRRSAWPRSAGSRRSGFDAAREQAALSRELERARGSRRPPRRPRDLRGRPANAAGDARRWSDGSRCRACSSSALAREGVDVRTLRGRRRPCARNGDAGRAGQRRVRGASRHVLPPAGPASGTATRWWSRRRRASIATPSPAPASSSRPTCRFCDPANRLAADAGHLLSVRFRRQRAAAVHRPGGARASGCATRHAAASRSLGRRSELAPRVAGTEGASHLWRRDAGIADSAWCEGCGILESTWLRREDTFCAADGWVGCRACHATRASLPRR